MRTLDKEVFEPLANLEVLLLDSNQLEDINGKVDHEVDNQDIKRDFKNSKTLRLLILIFLLNLTIIKCKPRRFCESSAIIHSFQKIDV